MKGGEHHAVCGGAEDQTGYDLPRGWRPSIAVAVPGGCQCLGRILAGDGITQGGGDHGGRQHGTVRGDKDGLGGPLRHRSVPSRDGGAGDGDAPTGDVRAASVGGRLVEGAPAYLYGSMAYDSELCSASFLEEFFSET